MSVATVYLILICYLFLFQKRMIYFPWQIITDDPSDINLEFEDVYIKTSDGINIHAWYIPADGSRATILFCHGNAGNLSHRLDTIRIFHELGLNVLIFDYRGYGKSHGNTTEKGTYLDALAAWDYLIHKKNIQSSQIIIAGRSLGGSVGAWLAKEKKPRGLIIESSFTSVPEMGQKIYPFFPIKLLSRFKYNTRDYIQEIECPIMIVHSRGDNIIPFQFGEELFKSAKDPKLFLEIAGDHNGGFIDSENVYKAGFNKFFKILRIDD
ncbi:alpha/beta hydrolase [Candidatus Dependentiae bacterium]|nr:alpha/beta hydrolase [Candidatus Dependentiae bacterium]